MDIMVERLAVVDTGIDPDITGLFLRVNEQTREKILKTIDIVGKYVPSERQLTGEYEHDWKLFNSIPDIGISQDVYEAIGETAESWFMNSCIASLKTYPKELLGQIGLELRDIANGHIELSSLQRKALSNLSNAGRRDYEQSLGFSIDNMTGPILDIGTGREALFARDLLERRPGLHIISTSIHLGSLISPMRSWLSRCKERGQFVAADSTGLPFNDEAFGTIVSLNAAPYYASYEEVPILLKEAHRVLKIGGTALFGAAVCDSGERQLNQSDVSDLNIDARVVDMPPSARFMYVPELTKMITVNK